MAEPRAKPRVLFLCTGNSCRSQMAEGWARALKGSEIEAYSAGTDPHGLNPLAVRAMAEAGVNIGEHTSKRPGDLGVEFDYVVTVCDAAQRSCPVLTGAARIIHAGFDDPPRLARATTNDEAAMPHYRRVRDEIRAFIETLPGALGADNTNHHLPKGNPMNDTTTTKPATPKANAPCCGPECCSGGSGATAAANPPTPIPPPPPTPSADEVRDTVRKGYAKIAESGSWSAAQSCAPGGGCCGPATFTPDQLARAIGYSQDELGAAPESANMGLSCGNPTALASLRPGETVLDLGAGGGFDCFIAGPKVGATGRVIGVDMTAQMVTKARANTASYTAQTGLSNVEFRLGEIENIPAADASVDVVISNCVLNLSPDQGRVWKEMARVLRPGGRAAVSDLVLLRPLPEEVRRDVEALVGCVAGAALATDVETFARDAGFADVRIERKGGYVDAMTDWQDPLYKAIVAKLNPGERIGDYVTSANITARKA